MIKKDDIIILLYAVIMFSKSAFDNKKERQTDIRIISLEFNHNLLKDLSKREDFKI